MSGSKHRHVLVAVGDADWCSDCGALRLAGGRWRRPGARVARARRARARQLELRTFDDPLGLDVAGAEQNCGLYARPLVGPALERSADHFEHGAGVAQDAPELAPAPSG